MHNGNHKSTGIIKHIDAVDKQKELLYRCLECGREMIVVKKDISDLARPRKVERKGFDIDPFL